jgi:hypothetical protein
MLTYHEQNPNYTLAWIAAEETVMWTAPGMLERWLVAMEAVGVPPADRGASLSTIPPDRTG